MVPLQAKQSKASVYGLKVQPGAAGEEGVVVQEALNTTFQPSPSPGCTWWTAEGATSRCVVVHAGSANTETLVAHSKLGSCLKIHNIGRKGAARLR